MDHSKTAGTVSGKREVICLPGKGEPVNRKAAEKTPARFNTDPWFGMMYAFGQVVEVSKEPRTGSRSVGMINNEAVIVRHSFRTDPDSLWEPVRLPDGVDGGVPNVQIHTFMASQICFGKNSRNLWKIVGYTGGGD